MMDHLRLRAGSTHDPTTHALLHVRPDGTPLSRSSWVMAHTPYYLRLPTVGKPPTCLVVGACIPACGLGVHPFLMVDF